MCEHSDGAGKARQLEASFSSLLHTIPYSPHLLLILSPYHTISIPYYLHTIPSPCHTISMPSPRPHVRYRSFAGIGRWEAASSELASSDSAAPVDPSRASAILLGTCLLAYAVYARFLKPCGQPSVWLLLSRRIRAFLHPLIAQALSQFPSRSARPT